MYPTNFYKKFLIITPQPMLYSFPFLLFLTFRIGLSFKVDYTYFYLFYIKNFEIFILKIHL